MSKALEKNATQQSTDYSKIKETKLTEVDNKLTASDKEISNYEKLAESMDDKLQRLGERFETEKHDALLYQDYKPRLRFIEKADALLAPADGYIQTRDMTLANSLSKAKGHFDEIVRAYTAKNAGYEVDMIGKNVVTPMGKTDIDVLLTNNDNGQKLWLENKRYDNTDISLDDKFRTKIDKMSSALEHGAMDRNNNLIKPDKAIFMSSGHISESAKIYAQSKGVMIAADATDKNFKAILKTLKGNS